MAEATQREPERARSEWRSRAEGGGQGEGEEEDAEGEMRGEPMAIAMELLSRSWSSASSAVLELSSAAPPLSVRIGQQLPPAPEEDEVEDSPFFSFGGLACSGSCSATSQLVMERIMSQSQLQSVSSPPLTSSGRLSHSSSSGGPGPGPLPFNGAGGGGGGGPSPYSSSDSPPLPPHHTISPSQIIDHLHLKVPPSPTNPYLLSLTRESKAQDQDNLASVAFESSVSSIRTGSDSGRCGLNLDRRIQQTAGLQPAAEDADAPFRDPSVVQQTNHQLHTVTFLAQLDYSSLLPPLSLSRFMFPREINYRIDPPRGVPNQSLRSSQTPSQI